MQAELRKIIVSSAIDVLLQSVERPSLGGFTLIPIAAPVRQDWWFIALLLGIAGAVAGVHTFETRGFTLRGFIPSGAVVLVAVLPFLLARYVEFGVELTVVALLAYFVLHGVIGVIIGAIVVTVWR